MKIIIRLRPRSVLTEDLAVHCGLLVLEGQPSLAAGVLQVIIIIIFQVYCPYAVLDYDRHFIHLPPHLT